MIRGSTFSNSVRAAYVIVFSAGPHTLLSLLVLGIAVADLIVLRKFYTLYDLVTVHETAADQTRVQREIVRYTAQNPTWIMLVTQMYSLLSIVLLLSKFL